MLFFRRLSIFVFICGILVVTIYFPVINFYDYFGYFVSVLFPGDSCPGCFERLCVQSLDLHRLATAGKCNRSHAFI